MSLNKKVIQIRNTSTDDEESYELFINGGSRATLSKKHGLIQIHWHVYGPQDWPDAKYLMQGLLELSVIADQLSGGGRDEDPEQKD